jgi:hypothetical protein
MVTARVAHELTAVPEALRPRNPETLLVTQRVAELRKLLLQLIAAVVLLDVVVIGLYYALHIQRTSTRTQTLFTGVWTVLTLIVVLVALGRIRAARRRR